MAPFKTRNTLSGNTDGKQYSVLELIQLIIQLILAQKILAVVYNKNAFFWSWSRVP